MISNANSSNYMWPKQMKDDRRALGHCSCFVVNAKSLKAALGSSLSPRCHTNKLDCINFFVTADNLKGALLGGMQGAKQILDQIKFYCTHSTKGQPKD